jgi:hypothetical protein
VPRYLPTFSRGALVLQLLMKTSPRHDVEDDVTAPRRGPVRCWCHVWASSAGRGALFHRGWHCEWRGPPKHGRSWPRVVLRHARSYLVSEVWLWSRAFMSMVVNEAWASVGFAPPPEGGRVPLGSGRTGLPSLGSSKAWPAPKGSGESHPTFEGSGEFTIKPSDHL